MQHTVWNDMQIHASKASQNHPEASAGADRAYLKSNLL